MLTAHVHSAFAAVGTVALSNGDFAMKILQKFLADEAGATGIEYGFLASLIAMALVSGFQSLGNEIQSTYETVDEEYSAVN